MIEHFAAQELPRRRTGGVLWWLERQSLLKIAFIGAGLYLLVVVSISLFEMAFHAVGEDLVFADKRAVSGFWDILYFNSITILTIGYGDLHPESYGKLLSVLEAFVGVGLFGALLSIATIKALLPPQNTIVFSKYAYYCTKDQAFLIIFVNTSYANLGNCELSSYFKLSGDWGVKPSITSPFITQAVQTFYLEYQALNELILNFKEGIVSEWGSKRGLGSQVFQLLSNTLRTAFWYCPTGKN